MKIKDDMRIISLLLRSKKRVEVLKSLEFEDKIPSKISKDIGDNSNHVSKYLKTLKDAELVVCLNEEDARYRFYSITDKGTYYLNQIKDTHSKECIQFHFLFFLNYSTCLHSWDMSLNIFDNQCIFLHQLLLEAVKNNLLALRIL